MNLLKISISLLKKNFFSFFIFLLFLGLLRDNVLAFSEVNVDDDFITNAGFNSLVVKLALQNDGKVIAGGNFTEYDGTPVNRIVRLNSDGSIDNTFVTGLGFDGNLRGLALQNDGRVIAGGFFTEYNGTPVNRIVRLNSDGSIDTSFNIGSGFTAGALPVVYAISVQSDGKILLGGSFMDYDGTPVHKMVRLNPDGAIDTSFNMGGIGFSTGVFDSIYRFGIQPDGKILVGGDFDSYNGTPVNRIVRLNSDGSIDNTFVTGLGVEDTPFPITLQDDGKILLGGNFVTYDGVTINSLVRLNSDGSIDNTFVTGLGFNSITRGIEVLSDGKILVVGAFSSYDGNPANGIVLLNSDGSIDTGFVSGIGAAGGSIEAFVRQPDGKLLLGGTFTTYDGNLANRIVRLRYDITLTAPIITSPMSGSAFVNPVTFMGTGASGNLIEIFNNSGTFVGSGLVDNFGIFSIGPVTISGGIYIPVATSVQGSFTGASIVLYPDVPPVLSLSGNNVVSMNVGISYQEQGAFWTDDVDGSGMLNLSNGAVNTGWILSGTINTSIAGTYTREYRYTDSAGNISNTVIRTVVVNPVNSPVFGGGGGGTNLIVDNCPSGDHSSSYYDNTCEGNTTPSDNPIQSGSNTISYLDSDIYNPSVVDGYCYNRKKDISLINSSNIVVSDEFKKALLFLLSYDMTIFDHIDEFRPNSNLTREQAAKLFSQFALNVLCREPNTSLTVLYEDSQEINPNLSSYLIQAYQLGLMKGSDNGKFRPKDMITKAEFNAVIVRMILKSYLPEDTGQRRYDEYNKVSSELGIISQSAGSESIVRKNAALMLFRSYKNQLFSLQDFSGKSFVLDNRDQFID